MSNEQTIPQGTQEQARSLELSLQHGQPPAQVPGYELERLLGLGAYGQVWVAIERNTGRRVAIKFYAHRGGLDWSLLSREVEKLAFLFADRYVVQLIGVGWDADPPYYVMEYLERGSLAERLHPAPLPAAEAVEMFHDIAVGLAHAHGKGVLHCDLKPANILLDQDNRPRLADFGQSRLSHEQVPALGTLFYMAPEQADLEAVPDVRWDVYALGALLYCMLTGQPPYREPAAVEQLDQTTDLRQRLAEYRRLIRHAPPPTAHRDVHGVDGALADVVDGCLAPDPRKRFPNVQAVLDALRSRAAWRTRRPMMVLGAVGPVLLLAVVSMFAWGGFGAAMRQSRDALTDRALESNRFAAEYVARTAANELESRWRSVEQLAGSGRMQRFLRQFLQDPEIRGLLAELRDPKADPADLEKLRQTFRNHPQRKALHEQFKDLVYEQHRPEANSWFIVDEHGIQLIRLAEDPTVSTVGKNYSWRSYFSGSGKDMPETWRPSPKEHIADTTLTPVYLSQATNTWMVAMATPIKDDDAKGAFRGIIGMTIEVGRFVELQSVHEQFAVMVDWRDGDDKGMLLQHPLFNKLRDAQGVVPDRFRQYKLQRKDLPDTPEVMRHYPDPVAAAPEGAEYRRRWLARMEPVKLRGQDTGWLVIVQEAYDTAIAAPLGQLEIGLIHYGLAALGMVAVVVLGLWAFTFRLLKDGPRRKPAARPAAELATGTGSGNGSGANTPSATGSAKNDA